VLAAVTEVGGRSMRAHQVTGLVIGLGVIAVAGLVGRRYAGQRVGVLAAFPAAVYPGFWVLDVQILSEPLGLLLAGLLMLVLADLWEGPALARALLAGGLSGCTGFRPIRGACPARHRPRPDPPAKLVVALRRRLARTGAATLVALVVISPWTRCRAVHRPSRATGS
jgi:hypothetical protein